MDERGNIRELAQDEALRPGEIELHGDVKNYESLSRAARRDYYRAIRQGLSVDAAMACAQATDRGRLR
jgi:ribonucleotide reductase beta subunit family protein with ferritin-like domain